MVLLCYLWYRGTISDDSVSAALLLLCLSFGHLLLQDSAQEKNENGLNRSRSIWMAMVGHNSDE